MLFPWAAIKNTAVSSGRGARGASEAIGFTLALDFPNRGAQTLALFEQLDTIIDRAGGRLYPAKDARMSAAFFQNSYPGLDDFEPFIDPKFSSDFARRVLA